MNEEEKQMILDSKELIDQLQRLYRCKNYKKANPLPKFTIQEARFIRDLIFWRTKGILFFYIVDYIMNDTCANNMPMFNMPSWKKLRFIINFCTSRSAKEAAIKAGYSPRTAKQQAYRLVREIHGYKRQS